MAAAERITSFFRFSLSMFFIALAGSATLVAAQQRDWQLLWADYALTPLLILMGVLQWARIRADAKRGRL